MFCHGREVKRKRRTQVLVAAFVLLAVVLFFNILARRILVRVERRSR